MDFVIFMLFGKGKGSTDFPAWIAIFFIYSFAVFHSGIQFLDGKTEVTEITDELLDALLEQIVVYADKTSPYFSSSTLIRLLKYLILPDRTSS